jgi:integrase
MIDIAKAVEECLHIDGLIRLKPYDNESCEYLAPLVLWDYIRCNKHQVTAFDNDSWYSQGNNLSITFIDINPQFQYQLKAMTLGMYTQGAGEGGEPLSWRTIRFLIGNLKRLAKWFQRYQINSFSDIHHIPELKLRNIIIELVQDSNLQKHPSFAQSLLSAIYWLKLYKVVELGLFFEFMNEYLAPFTLLKIERKKKHSIIPVQIMKQVLNISEKHILAAEGVFDDWSLLQKKLNDAIPYLPSSEFKSTTYIDVFSSDESEELNGYHPLIKSLRSYTFALILSYTGMRYSEVMALTDDSAIDNDGEYYLKSLLSKTTDGTQSLEWITNAIVFKAVDLMDRVNQVYRERASLLLQHHGEVLPTKIKLNLEFGLDNRTLFGVSFLKKSCQFTVHTKASSSSFNSLNKMFSISLIEEDISELERMECNYQSVNSKHKYFKQPYKVGDYFSFTAHQFRHTFAWFIVANRLGDLDDIKYQYKHLENMMTLVYSQRGYESMEKFIGLTDSFSEFMLSQTMEHMITAAQDGSLAGKGGQSFISKLTEILSDDLTTGSTPHFNNMQELLTFAAKHTKNFRGLSHGYCTKGSECKVRNAADPSHCVSCEGYIATPRHLPHWIVIKKRCESQLAGFDQLSTELKVRFKSFSTALNDNLEAANNIINQLTIKVKEA